MKKFDIVGIIDVLPDFYLKVDKFPEVGEKVIVKFLGWFGGGMVGNFSYVASKLGLSVALMGKLPQDKFSTESIKELRNCGVNLDSIRMQKNSLNRPFTIVVIDSSSERTIFVVPNITESVTLTKRERDLISKSKILYATLSNLAIEREAILIAKRYGVKVCANLEAMYLRNAPDIFKLFKNIDILIFNKKSFKEISKKGFEETTAKKILSEGSELIVITKGKEGCTVYSQKEKLNFPSYKVNVIDTTGAGDCFSAAFLFGYINNWGFKKTSLFASAAAALSTTQLGPRPMFCSYQEIVKAQRNMKSVSNFN